MNIINKISQDLFSFVLQTENIVYDIEVKKLRQASEKVFCIKLKVSSYSYKVFKHIVSKME